MKNRLISRVCFVLLTAAMLVTSAPASVFAESIGEESVFTDVETENDFAEPEAEDVQEPESEDVEDVTEEPETEASEADQLSDFSDGATVQGTDQALTDSQVDADQVASVSVDMLNAQTEFYEYLTDPCRIVGAVLHITYGDGFTNALTFNQYSSTVEDNDKGYQWTYTYEKYGQPVSGMLDAGTYDLVLTGKDIRGKGRPDVTVTEGIRPITIKPRRMDSGSGGNCSCGRKEGTEMYGMPERTERTGNFCTACNTYHVCWCKENGSSEGKTVLHCESKRSCKR